jgi:hypothetical protein
MSASHHPMSMSSLKDRKSFLELFRCNNRLPVTTQRFGSDALFHVDNPARIRPVMKDVGHGVVVDLALAIGFHFNEGSPTAIVIAANVKFLGDFFKGEFIAQQQIPRQTPDFGTLRVLLNVMAFFAYDFRPGASSSTLMNPSGTRPRYPPCARFVSAAPLIRNPDRIDSRLASVNDKATMIRSSASIGLRSGWLAKRTEMPALFCLSRMNAPAPNLPVYSKISLSVLILFFPIRKRFALLMMPNILA